MGGMMEVMGVTYPFNRQVADHSASRDYNVCVWKDGLFTRAFFSQFLRKALR